MPQSHGAGEPDRMLMRARPARSLRVAAVIWVGGFVGPWDVQAQAAKPTEYQVKAAYLNNFGRFVEWPSKVTARKGSPFAVCVLGQDPFGTDLDGAIAREMIDGAPVVARRIAKPQDAADCRVLFISSSEDGQWKEISATLDKLNILTVSDMPQFARRGGMIQFVLEGSKVRFEISLTAAERAGLNLSSELLRLAINVRRGP